MIFFFKGRRREWREKGTKEGEKGRELGLGGERKRRQQVFGRLRESLREYSPKFP